MTDTVEPSLATLARGLSQYAEEQRETRTRLEVHIEASGRYFLGLERMFDGLRDTISAQHLLVSGDIGAARRDIATVEEHIGLLTTMVTAHGKRLDGIDSRLDGIDGRLDGIDSRLDAHDKRFDAIDTRLDGIDARLGGLTDVVVQIRDAVIPRG
ncbi:hypothetical protein [Microbacterium terrisoli]|jgi:hypothetical protein|uniref:hypothetical protein n=1 Tax=Microbacterium terrisoli TaxID=3242192 RepID=UPI0028044BA8|nr:hypothetical protein [Microbacterium protaetiae]